MAAKTDKEKKYPDWWYQSKNQEEMNAVAGQIASRPAFRFEVNHEALYDYYKGEHERQGREAQMDTQAKGAALTGGYGNSYAAQAGQRAYDTQMEKLNRDVVPELREMAADQYDRETKALTDRFSALQKQEKADRKAWEEENEEKIEAWEQSQREVATGGIYTTLRENIMDVTTPAQLNRFDRVMASAPGRALPATKNQTQQSQASKEAADKLFTVALGSNGGAAVYYARAVDQMKAAGVSSGTVSGLLKEKDWKALQDQAIKNYNSKTGALNLAAVAYDNYTEYLRAYVSMATNIKNANNVQGIDLPEGYESTGNAAFDIFTAEYLRRVQNEDPAAKKFKETAAADHMKDQADRAEAYVREVSHWNDRANEINLMGTAGHRIPEHEQNMLEWIGNTYGNTSDALAAAKLSATQTRRLADNLVATNRAIYADDFAEKSVFDSAVTDETYRKTNTRGEDNFLEDQEIAVYNYIYATEGAAKAQAYLDTLVDELNKRKGQSKADSVDGNFLGQMWVKAQSGFDQFGSGIASLFNDGQPKDPSVIQYASAAVDEDLAEVDLKWYNFADKQWKDQDIFGRSLGQMAGDTVQTTANMLPSIGASAVISAINPTAGAWAGAILMGSSAAGNAYQDMLNQGYSKGSAATYGTLVGISEALLEKVLGGISPISGGGGLQKFASKFAKVDGVLKRFADSAGGKILLNAGSEAVEEGLQSVLEPFFKTIVTGEEFTVDMEEALYSALLGFVTGGMFESGTQAINGVVGKISDSIRGKKDMAAEAAGNMTQQAAPVASAGVQSVAGKDTSAVKTPSATASAPAQADVAATVRNDRTAQTGSTKTENVTLKAASKKYGAQAATMESAYQEGQDVERFDREYKLAYDMGKEGTSRELLDNGGAFAYLTAQQKNTAYQSGAAAAENAGIVAEVVKSLGITGEHAGALTQSFNANQITAKDYAMGLQEAYEAGKTGIPMKEAGSHAAKLTDAQRQIAYKQGQKAGGRQVAKQQAQVRKNRSAEGADTSKGKVHFDGDRSSLNKTQRASMDAMEVLAKTLGVQVYVENFEGTKNANKNGWYDPKDGSIHININAGADGKGTMLFTVAHELTHFIRQWSPAKFRVLANFVTKRYAEKGISVRDLMDDQIAKAKEDDRELTDEEALEEVVADSMETMLVDGSIMEMMAEIRQQDHGLWAKIKEWFRDLAGKLQAVVDAYKGVQPDSDEGRMVAEMKDMIGTLQALYMDALVDASENFDAGVQKNTTEDSGVTVRYMARGETETIKKQLLAVAEQLNKMEIVSSVQTDGYSGMWKDEIAKIIESEYAKFGKRVDRQNFGVILLEFNQINKALNYLNTDGEKAALLTVPRVLKRGIIAESHNKHKERQVDSITFAAPVEINGVRGNVAVVVQRVTGTNRFKTLRILLPNGKAFKFVKNDEADSTTGGSSKQLGLEGTPIESASKNSIRNPEPEVKKKFSLRGPVERTKDLVALHNLTEDKLLKALDLGGFPMPSIAVTKSDIPHTNFGDITLVFGSETIDPKASRKNAVYSADAWTPTFPRVEFEADEQLGKTIYRRLGEAETKVDTAFRDDIRRVRYGFEDNLNRYGGESGLIESLLDNYGLKAAYLEETGQHVNPIVTQVENSKGFSEQAVDKYKQIIEILGTEDSERIGQMPLADIREHHSEALEKIYPGMTKSALRMGRILSQVRAYIENQNSQPTYSTVTDMQAMKKAIDDAINQEAFKEWVRQMFSGIEKSRGVYNQKPLFTPSGNRRSFQQTHLPATLENIVKAMAAQNGGSTKNISGFNGIKTLRAGTAQRFRSIADMHAHEGRLQNLTEEQFATIQDQLQGRMFDIIEAVDQENGHSGSDNSLIRYDIIGEILMEISEGGRYNVTDIQEGFKRNYKQISDETALKVKELLYDVSQMPVNIFEAKPERAVGFDEVKAAILPDGTDPKIAEALKNSGAKVYFYEKGDNETRRRLVNSMQEYKFSQRDVGRQEAVTQALEKENAKLREDVAELRELVKLQRQVTNGTKFTKTSVEAAAISLKQGANAKGSTQELAKLLNGLYEYIASGKELTWEGVKEQAQGAVDWLWEHIDRRGRPTEYAQEILRQIHGARVRLDESQMAEAEYRFGSYEQFRKGLMGSITFAKNAEMSLDSLWAELSEMYPDVFDSEITAADMPGALVDIIHRLRSPDTAVDYARNRELMEQELLRDIYDSYWRVSTLYTPADVGARRINKLKMEHYQRMDKLKQQHRETIDRLKQAHQARLEQVRKEHRVKLEEKVEQVTKRYQDARKQNVEGRKKTEQRRKIRKTIRELSKLLVHGTKERNVKEGMKDFVSTAIASAEVLFTDEYTNEDMVRNGVACYCEAWESSLLDKTRALIRQRDDLLATYPTAKEMDEVVAGDLRDYEQRMKEVRRLERKISENMGKLRDVFVKERARMNEATVSSLLSSLAEEYWKLGTSEEAYIRGALDENVHQHLMNLSQEIGGTTVKDMSLSQLEDLHRAYTMVLTTVRNANKSFAENLKGSRQEQAQAVVWDLAEAGKKRKKQTKGQIARAKRSWNNEKPAYAFERIGSGTLKQLYENLRGGEDTWMVDMDQAREFFLKAAKDSGYNGWDLNKQIYSFESSTGLKFDLNLGQIMSIYAYARRGQQAIDHLMKGGFVFDQYTEERVTEHGIPKTYLKDDATAYNLSLQTIQEIIGKLTPEQTAFVETMQDYLSDTMGGKGNEVSMKLYGVKLFGEKHYFPLRSSGAYMDKAKTQELQKQQGQVSIKNSGFTHSTKTNAANPVVLSGFMDVWAGHVNDMSMYHAFVLPLEDFNRVYHFSSPHTESGQSGSVNQAIINACGSAATGYIDQFIRDLNGGVVADPREGDFKRWISKFKKASVMASASVVVQQPSAIVRALAYIDPKYFGVATLSRGIGRALGNKITHNHTKLYDELKRYAPVAAIKQMGRFDTDMGLGAVDYLTAKEFQGFREKLKAVFTEKGYLGKQADEITGFAAARADEITWAQIWQAVKNEVADKQGLTVGSEEHLKAAGQRFTEVVTRTQVYDSVFSRSANMRSKGAFMSMVTSFMAEPTTTANMLTDAIRKAKQGDVKFFLRVGASVAGAIVFNNILRSAVYAMRDDDEDETLVEKYLQALSGGLLDDMNPMSYLPFWRDVWSLAQRYDVERADMSVIGTLMDAGLSLAEAMAKDTDGMTEEELEAHNEKLKGLGWKFVDGLASAVGLPEKNLRRDILGAVNFFETVKADGGRQTTAGSLKDKVWEDFVSALPGVNILVDTDSKTDDLYDAIVAGDSAYLERLKSGYKTEQSYLQAKRKGLKENDVRIKTAAKARMEGDLESYMTIATEIIAEGRFTQDDVVVAINGVINELTPGGSSASAPKAKGLFDANAFATAISQDDAEMAKLIQADIIRTVQQNGKTEEEAKKSFVSSVTSACKEMFGEGELSEEQAVEALTEFCGKDKTEARASVAYWDFAMEHPDVEASAGWFESYYRKVENSGIAIEDYVEYRNRKTGYTKREDILEVIDGMDLTKARKDTLYRAEGYAESTLDEAPWHK